MDFIKDVFALSQEEIAYKMSCLTELQLQIVGCLARGMSVDETAKELKIHAANVSARMASAWDRVGLQSKAEMIALYSIWEYAAKKNEVEKRENVKNSCSGRVSVG